MGDGVKVSVIVPVYNVDGYLRLCLDSIINQTLWDIEIICIDDGSTDTSLDILNEYGKKDNRIKIISRKNSGAGAARNYGLSIARGEYLSFLDSDDFFENDMLELAYNKALEEKSQVVIFDSDQYFQDIDKCEKIARTILRHALPPYSPMNHYSFCENVFKVFVGWAWDKLFEAEFVKKYQLTFQEQRTTNDMLFVYTAIILADRISVLDKVLAHHRRNVNTSLSNTREQSWDCFYHALKALEVNLKKYNLEYALKQDYVNYALHFSLWNLETLTGEKKEILYKKLKNEWFQEFGILDKESDYFYNMTEYLKYKKIMAGRKL